MCRTRIRPSSPILPDDKSRTLSVFHTLRVDEKTKQRSACVRCGRYEHWYTDHFGDGTLATDTLSEHNPIGTLPAPRKKILKPTPKRNVDEHATPLDSTSDDRKIETPAEGINLN